MRGSLQFRCAGALLACAALVPSAAMAATQPSPSASDDSAAARLGRYVRALASDATDFDSLIGAGRAALELGDTHAAAAFFARADAADPRSPLPQIGMGAVSVANGDAAAAMPYFTRAQQLGATQAMLGCDRGLAYDMMGQQALAQADYRAALYGRDSDETRRRLALSLAISGNKAGALAAIAPLSAKGDASSPRVRAFVLALTGDSAAAMRAIDSAMPGSWASVAPFLQRLPRLAPGQKAAAVNLGIFPDSNGTAIASASPGPQLASAAPSALGLSQAVTSDRLAGIDALLGATPPQPQQPVYQAQSAYQPQQPAYRPQPTQVSYTTSVPSLPAQPAGTIEPPKIWLELQTGGSPDELSRRFEQLKASNRDLFDGIPGYVAEGPKGTRLIVGPFRGPSDASIFAADLQSAGLMPMRWTNSAYDRIVPVAAE